MIQHPSSGHHPSQHSAAALSDKFRHHWAGRIAEQPREPTAIRSTGPAAAELASCGQASRIVITPIHPWPRRRPSPAGCAGRAPAAHADAASPVGPRGARPWPHATDRHRPAPGPRRRTGRRGSRGRAWRAHKAPGPAPAAAAPAPCSLWRGRGSSWPADRHPWPRPWARPSCPPHTSAQPHSASGSSRRGRPGARRTASVAWPSRASGRAAWP
mmetsp:Transcript_30050/g.54636  ORF Transcript_30050/g.54636 Transcript_30050/m.54636 type:complete len:214 (+) Transcript_30050:2-643(+)